MRDSIFRLFLTSCLFALFGNAYSQEWISLGGNAKGKAVTMNVLQDDTSAYRIKCHINGINDYSITNEKGSFHHLSLDDSGKTSVVGAPSLPVINRFIAIPEGAELSVSIIGDEWTDIEVGRIYPTQYPTLDSKKASEFYLDEKAYQQVFAPQQIKIGKEKDWRGVRCVNLSLCPFRYNPVNGHLSVMRDFVLRVEFIPGRLPLATKKVYENADPFRMFDNHIFPVSNSISGVRSGMTNTMSNCPEGDLLIIVGDGLGSIMNSDKMKEYRLWKAFRGFNTRMVSITTIGSGEDNLRNYISQQYNDGVRYVLFVGDYAQINLKYMLSHYDSRVIYSDYWYGCSGGANDSIADVSIGRFSTNQLSEFSNMVDKTIKYEKSYYALNQSLLVAHFEESYLSSSYTGCCKAIQNTSYCEPTTFIPAYGAHSSNGGNNATNSYVLSFINERSNIINYRGHGGIDVWGNYNYGILCWNCFDEQFHSSQINNMDDGTCSIFFSIACSTGSVQENSDCMLETFTRSPHGAAAFVGATTETYKSVNNEFDKAIFHKLLNDSVYRLGDIVNSAHEKCKEQFNANYTNAIENPYCYILGGDPTLEVWTREPRHINNVDFSVVGDSVHITFDSITNDSSYCSLVRAEDGVHISNVKFSGQNVSFLKPDYNFYVVINSHNYYPYVIYCDFDTEELVHSFIDYEAHFYESPIVLQDGLVDDDPYSYGVTVQNGGKLVIHKGTGGVIIHDTFECEKGGTLEIK